MVEVITAPEATSDEMGDLLVAVAERKDRAAFVRLFDHFAPRVKSYLRRLGVGDSQAEDLVQEVMLTVWRNMLKLSLSSGAAAGSAGISRLTQ